LNGARPMLVFVRRMFDAYVRAAGRYPLPMAWAI
jgi:hypothetical protein